MGSALLASWRATHPAGLRRFTIIEPMQRQTSTDHVRWFNSLDEIPEPYHPGVVVFAVKPQQMDDVLPRYRERFKDIHALYISIAAGKTLRYLSSQLGERAAIVRAMPNTPAAISQGMTLLVSAPTLPASAKHLATELMQASGDVVWLENESLMDTATAISGSGPAYCFLFMECLVAAATEAGLSESVARQLAVSTLSGSAALAKASNDMPLAELRRRVTSPGGTTEAALGALMGDDALRKLVQDAVRRATQRAKEL